MEGANRVVVFTYGGMVEWFTMQACHALWYRFESGYPRQSQDKETYSKSRQSRLYAKRSCGVRVPHPPGEALPGGLV